MILFGRRKFAVMLVGGSLLSWLVLVAADSLAPGLLSINELPIAALFVPALLANDMERTSIVSVATGGLLAASVTLPVVVGMAAVVDGTPVPLWVGPLLAVSSVILLWPQISPRLGGLWRRMGRRPSLRPPRPPGGGGGLWATLDDLVPMPGRLQPAYVDGRNRANRYEMLGEDPMEPVSWQGALVRHRPESSNS